MADKLDLILDSMNNRFDKMEDSIETIKSKCNDYDIKFVEVLGMLKDNQKDIVNNQKRLDKTNDDLNKGFKSLRLKLGWLALFVFTCHIPELFIIIKNWLGF